MGPPTNETRPSGPRTPEKMTTRELATKCNISLRNLEQECSDNDILALAEFCDPWEFVGSHLKLTEAQISAIQSDNKTTEERRLASLRKWKETQSYRATFKAYVDALIECKFVEKARKVCEYRAKQVNDLAIVSQEAVFNSSETDPSESSDQNHDHEQQAKDRLSCGLVFSNQTTVSRYRFHSCKHQSTNLLHVAVDMHLCDMCSDIG